MLCDSLDPGDMFVFRVVARCTQPQQTTDKHGLTAVYILVVDRVNLQRPPHRQHHRTSQLELANSMLSV
jgi:hypothetical protein